MTRADQRQRELRLVKALIRHEPELSGLLLASVDDDPPDVRAGEDIGIEVAEYHRRRTSRAGRRAHQVAIEKAREEVTLTAKELYEAGRNRPLYVHIHYRDGVLPVSQAALLAEQLCEAVRSAASAAKLPCDIRGDRLPTPSSTCVDRIHVSTVGRGWVCLSGGSVENTWDHIEELMRGKENDLPRWPIWAKRRWLLVVAPAIERVKGLETLLFSSMLPQLGILPPPELGSDFDRVRVLDVATGVARQIT